MSTGRQYPENVVVIEKASCVAETDKAIKVEAPDLREPIWVPKSVIHEDSEVYETATDGDLVVQKWWADKEKLG